VTARGVLVVLTLSMLGRVPSVGAETLPAAGPKDARIRHVLFDPDDVVRLDGYVGYQIHLQFAPEERFVQLAAGNTAAFDVGTEGPHVMLKPRLPSVETNLTLLTNLRVYHFAYRATRIAPGIIPPDMIWSLRYEYAVVPVMPASEPAKVVVRNENYRSCGKKSLWPTSVYDDGQLTHLQFARQTEWPAVFAVGTDGEEQLVNFHVSGDEMVLHRVADRWVLRRGKAIACVERAVATGDAR
jgi:type IV secretion system protein VirB9